MSHPGLFNEEPNISFTNSTGLPVLRQDVSDTPLISELLTLPRLFLGPTIAIGSGHFFLSVLNSKLQILVIERAGLFLENSGSFIVCSISGVYLFLPEISWDYGYLGPYQFA